MDDQSVLRLNAACAYCPGRGTRGQLLPAHGLPALPRSSTHELVPAASV